jgi:2-isopropylmalate synthase
LGYDLGPEDEAHVYEAFLLVAAKKKVNARELEAIVATTALQVPPTYQLVNYLTNSGNVISSSAHITLNKKGQLLEGITIGDGPIDAAFMAIEQIVGHHYDLDDFQIQSVTQGHEAMGTALVRLRNGGKIYSGNGISTDIIGASIRAYLNALNKIVYEEATE